MTDRAQRINDAAFALIESTCNRLTADGAPDAVCDVETLAAIGIAYAVCCKIMGHTFEQIEPILRNSFTAVERGPVVNSIPPKGDAS